MAWKCSACEELVRMRRNGQRPDGPVVIGDEGSWAIRNGFFFVPRREITEDLMAFCGLDVWLMTARPFADSAELAFALAETARFVTLIDSRHRVRSEFVSSMGKAA